MFDNEPRDSSESGALGAAASLYERLSELGIEDAEVVSAVISTGVSTPEDLGCLKEADLVAQGIAPVQARKLLAAIKPATPTAELLVLPEAPGDDELLKALKLGGVLKVEESTVVAAIRVALANKAGYFQIPDKLLAAIEAYAEDCEEQVPAAFFALRKALLRSGDYAEIFSGLEGCDGTYVNASRKKKFLRERLGEGLWAALRGSFEGLASWQKGWADGLAAPAMLALAAASIGGVEQSASASRLLSAPPDVGPVLDGFDGLKDALNHVFRGTGVQVTAALVCDAIRTRGFLEDPNLPGHMGLGNREQMLTSLGVGVAADYARLESSLVQYALGCLAANEDSTTDYLTQLYMLGTQIKWESLV